MIKNFKWLLLVSLTFVACNNNDETIVSNSSDGLPLTSGTADFSKFVALGNSLCSGFSDGALFIEGQKGAYPNILAQQFALVGGGAFKIPFMNDNLGGFSSGGNALPASYGLGVRKFFNGCVPQDVSGISGTVLGSSIAANGPYNNTGVPGARCIDLVTPGFAASNPYFARFATSPTQTVLEYATSQSPTFFSLWIGSNDVLGYALKGGDATLAQITPSAGAVGVGFNESYIALVNSLTANGAKGIVANIPYVTSIPMFTTITVNPVAPYTYNDEHETGCGPFTTTTADIGVINLINTNLISKLHAMLPDRFSLLSTTSNNPLLIVDESLEDKSSLIVYAARNSGDPVLASLANYLGTTYGKARQTKNGDLIPLTTKGIIGTTNTSLPAPILAQGLGAYGITYPLNDKDVLVPSEIEEIRLATVAFNNTIKAAAEAKGLAFVDANALMTQIANGGISENGYNVTSSFATGGGFSLDGVHPCPRGYALIANKFIETINAKYGSNLKGVNLYDYRIMFPPSL